MSELRNAWLKPIELSIADAARERIETSSQKISEVLDSGDQVYGVNTGFGLLANVRVSGDELDQLQDNIIRSHAVGLGKNLSDNIVRLVILMKIKALAEGYSGVRTLV
ncbi:uncharacterized protein METZ01_LOCUS377558, partial [marine metagenome]